MHKKFYTDIRKYGNKILHRGYENGIRIDEEVKFQPSMFMHTKDDSTSEWKDLYGKQITKLDFDSINDCEDFYKRYDGVSGMEISGHKKYAIQFSHDRYPNVIEYDPSLIYVSFQDIEVHSDDIHGFPFPHKADHPVVTISSVTSRNTIFCVSLKPKESSSFILEPEFEGYPVEYIQARDEKHLFMVYLAYLRREDFDIFSGWYCAKFDFPYLFNRMKKIVGEANAKKLSPHGIVYYKQFEKFGKIECDLDIYGIQVLDYLELFLKFAKVSYGPQEDYKLNTIANVVLGEKKIDYSEYGSLKNLYNENPKLHTEYCIKDSLLVKQMNDKIRYINIALSMSYKGHVNFSDSLGVTELWDSYIYGELLKEKVCVPPYLKHDSSGFEGAYVKPVITGLHRWVLSVDIRALYPHILAQYNISPETLGDYIDGVSVDSLMAGNFPDFVEGFCIGAKGWTFSKDKLGIIPRLVLKGLAARDELKTKMIDAKKEFNVGVEDEYRKKILEDLIIILDSAQAAEKEMLNSLYGALGAGAFRYFDYRLAETVTLTGQVTIKTLEKTINTYLQSIMNDKKDRIVAMDTDSCYIILDDVIKHLGAEEANDLTKVKILDRFYTDKLNVVIEEASDLLAKKLGCDKNLIIMKREGIASVSIHAAKKRYIQWILNSEGVQYKEPKLKIMGIEAIKSSTPAAVKVLFKEAFKIMILEGEKSTQDFIESKFDYYKTLSYYDISKPSGISDIEKYHDEENVFGKKCPKHVRASLFYNKLLKDLNIEDKYSKIYSADKVKLLNLRLPNPIHSDCIAYVDVLPKEFDLEKYIDYADMWDLTFRNPMKNLMEICGWEVEESDSLEAFFG